MFEFFPDRRTLRKEETYIQMLHLKMSVTAENTADAPKTCDPERIDEPVNFH